MRSRSSFFNRTVFWKNVTLCWPFWGGYFVYLLFVYPVTLGMRLFGLQKQAMDTKDFDLHGGQLEALAEVLSLEKAVWAVAIMALAVGMVLFYYLSSARSAQTIHALPMTRLELYGTHVVSGLIFLALPQILSFLTGMGVCLFYGMTHMEYLGLFLLVELGLDVLMFGMVVLCAMISGIVFVIPVFFLIGNVLFLVIESLLGFMVSFLGYGIETTLSGDSIGLVLSPLVCLLGRLDTNVIYSEDLQVPESIRFENIHYIPFYAAFGLLLLVCSCLLYRRRQMETTGDLVTVRFVRPVFRWGAGFYAAYIIGIFFVELVMADSSGVMQLGAVLSIGFTSGILFFFFAQMLLEKSTQIVGKKIFIEAACFAVFLLASFGALRAYTYMTENYIPAQGDIREAQLDIDGELVLGEEEISRLIGLHERILTYAGQYRYGRGPEDSIYVRLGYTLKNGKVITRSYSVPREIRESGEYLWFDRMQQEPELFVRDILGMDDSKNFADVNSVMAEIGRKVEDREEISDTVDIFWRGDTELSAAKEVYDAVMADARDGVLQKYNLTAHENDEQTRQKSFDFFLVLQWSRIITTRNITEDEIITSNYYEGSEGEYYPLEDSSIYFGSDCVHICRLMQKYHILDEKGALYGRPDTQN